MKYPQLVFNERCEDALLYMGHLFLLMEDWSIKVLSLAEIVTKSASSYPDLERVLPMFFERNDWLASPATRGWLSDGGVQQQVEAILGRFPANGLEVDLGDKYRGRFDVGFGANVVLDLHLYMQRLYVGGDKGLFHLDIEINDDVEPRGQAVQRMDVRTQAVNASRGAINASCGDYGLYSSLDDFGWLQSGQHGELDKIADLSARTAWFHQTDVVNYESAASTPTRIRTDSEKVHIGIAEQERSVLVSWGARESLDYLIDQLLSNLDVERADIGFLHNSGGFFFAQVRDHGIVTGRLGESDSRLQIRSIRQYGPDRGRALSMQAATMNRAGNTRAATVIEEENAVAVLESGEVETLIDGPVLSARTYPRSKRYKSLLTAVQEDTVSLIALFDSGNLKK